MQRTNVERRAEGTIPALRAGAIFRTNGGGSLCPTLACDFCDRVSPADHGTVDRKLNNESGGYPLATAQGQFGAGIEDVILLPLVFIAVAARKLFQATLSILVHILDYAFPVLLQLARFPLFTARIIGDGVTVGLKGVIRLLPVSGTTREEWRQFVSWHWSWLRQEMSYKAFEEAVHQAFEGGMAWVFRTCRTLTPGGALLVIAGAIFWLPVSFAAATAMHAVLIANAESLPPWMQLLHPLAAIIAKSKLLVLPAYPAAWPQAKKHSFVQATLRVCQFVAAHYLVQKTEYRYRQTERAAADAGIVLGRVAALVGLSNLSNRLLAGFNGLAAWIGKASRATMTRTVRALSALPLIDAIVRRYATHYDDAERQRAERLSEKIKGFFERWSIKFSAEYYEAKEASKGKTCTQDGADRLSAVNPPHAEA